MAILTQSSRRTIPGAMARRWWPYVLVVLVNICLPVSTPDARAQAAASPEYQLKAAFLFNFAKFIDWPTSSFASPRSDFSICILGVDPFGRAMEDLLQDKTIADRHVSVERLHQVAEARRCQMVFVSASEKSRVREVLDGMKGTNALVVGETDGFASAGGAIQFAIEDNRVRFLINTDAADRAGLKVSSKLLSLARVVHDGN
jgi:hypothetical protein